MINLAIFHPRKFVIDSFKLFILKHNTEFTLIEINDSNSKECTYGFEMIIVEAEYLTNRLRQEFIKSLFEKKIKILVLGKYSDEPSISYFFSIGANCYLKEDEGFETIYHAINILNKSGLYCPYKISRSLTNKNYRPKPIFSEKELQIFNYFREERTNQEVSSILGIHIKTVEFHRKNIIEKCGAKNLLGAFDYLISNGLIPLINK